MDDKDNTLIDLANVSATQIAILADLPFEGEEEGKIEKKEKDSKKKKKKHRREKSSGSRKSSNQKQLRKSDQDENINFESQRGESPSEAAGKTGIFKSVATTELEMTEVPPALSTPLKATSEEKSAPVAAKMKTLSAPPKNKIATGVPHHKSVELDPRTLELGTGATGSTGHQGAQMQGIPEDSESGSYDLSSESFVTDARKSMSASRRSSILKRSETNLESDGSDITFNGEHFSQPEIIKYFDQKESHIHLNLCQTLVATLYHVFFFCAGPFVGIPLVFLTDRFIFGGSGTHTLRNFGFWGRSSATYLQWIEALFSMAVCSMLVIDIIQGNSLKALVLQHFDYCLILIVRSAIIGVKYGYMSPEQWQFLRMATVDHSFFKTNTLYDVILDHDVHFIEKRLMQEMRRLQISEEDFALQLHSCKGQPIIEEAEESSEYGMPKEAPILTRLMDSCEQKGFYDQELHRHQLKKGNRLLKIGSKVSSESEQNIRDVLARSQKLTDEEVTRALKFNRAFGDLFSHENPLKASTEKIEHVLGLSDLVEVDALNMLIEIYFGAYRNAAYQSGFELSIILSIIYAFSPWLFRLIHGVGVFDVSTLQLWTEILVILPRFYQFFLSISMIGSLSLILHLKTKQKQLFLSILDPKFTRIFSLKGQLPPANLFSASTLETLQDMHSVLSNLDRKFLARANSLTILITAVFSVQAIFIYVNLMLGGLQLDDFGFEYAMQSIFIFSVVAFVDVKASFDGIRVNKLDMEIKNKLMQVQQDCNKLKILANQGRVYGERTPGQKGVTIIIEQEQKLCEYFNAPIEDPSALPSVLSKSEMPTASTTPNLPSTPAAQPQIMKKQSVSSRLMKNIDVLEETLTKKIEVMDHKLEFEQIKSIIGTPLTSEFILQVGVVMASIYLSLGQMLIEERMKKD